MADGNAAFGEIDPNLVRPIAPSDGVAAPAAPIAPASPTYEMFPDGAPASSAAADPDTVNSLAKSIIDTPLPGDAPKTPPGGKPAHHKPNAPTRFVQAGTPAPANQPEPSWGEVGQQALHNALPSAEGALGAIGHSIMHPIQTAENIGQLGAGFASQAAGALGVQQDPAQKAKTEALATALENHYKTAYGSTAGFKKAVATDPVGVAMDASTLIDPAAGVLGKVGEAGKLGALSDAANVASKVLPYANPAKTALAVARGVAKPVSGTLQKVGSLTSRLPPTVLDLAKAAGQAGGDAQSAFTTFATGNGDSSEVLQRMKNVINQVKGENNAAYLADKGALAKTPLSFTNTTKAITDAYDRLSHGAPDLWENQKKVVDQVAKGADDIATNPDPAKRGIIDGDAFKQQVWNLIRANPDSASFLTPIHAGIKADMNAVDPAYTALMEKYQAGLDNVNNLQKTFQNTTKNPSGVASMAKSLRALKTGPGTSLFNQIITRDPTIGGALAGAAANPWHHSGSLWEALAGGVIANPGAAMAGIAHPGTAMVTIPGAVAGYAAASPRVIASGANLAGKTSRLLNTAASPAGQLAGKIPYYAGRADELQNANSSDTPPAPTNLDQVKKAVSGVESAGSGGYSALGPVVTHPGGTKDQAIGKYQVLASHVPSWTEKYYGQRLTPEQFRDNPEAQEKVFEGAFGDLAAKYGNIPDAISAWHSGVPLDQAISEKRHDPNMSTQDYVSRVESGLPTAATGGRIERASGGKVDANIERLVKRLMSLAETAKRQENNKTEPLLNASDDVVARALKVAQRGI